MKKIKRVLSGILVLALVIAGLNYTSKPVKAEGEGFTVNTISSVSLDTEVFKEGAEATVDGQTYRNLVTGKTGIVSVEKQSGSESIDNITDGTTSLVVVKTGGSFIIDLGSEQDLKQFVLHWNGTFATDYLIQLSTDNEDYKTVAVVHNSATTGQQQDTITLTEIQSAQYIKIFCGKSSNGENNELQEFAAFGLETGTDQPIQPTNAVIPSYVRALIPQYNVLLNTSTIYQSGAQNGNAKALTDAVFNMNNNGYWRSQQKSDNWLIFDLGQEVNYKDIDTFMIEWSDNASEIPKGAGVVKVFVAQTAEVSNPIQANLGTEDKTVATENESNQWIQVYENTSDIVSEKLTGNYLYSDFSLEASSEISEFRYVKIQLDTSTITDGSRFVEMALLKGNASNEIILSNPSNLIKSEGENSIFEWTGVDESILDEGCTLLGYNFYVNGEKVNTEIIQDTFYDAVQALSEDGLYTIEVCAVYNIEEETEAKESSKVALRYRVGEEPGIPGTREIGTWTDIFDNYSDFSERDGKMYRNLAGDATFTASSYSHDNDDENSQKLEHASFNDGKQDRWQAANGNYSEQKDEWIKIDLGSVHGIKEVDIDWERSLAQYYQVRIGTVEDVDSCIPVYENEIEDVNNFYWENEWENKTHKLDKIVLDDVQNAQFIWIKTKGALNGDISIREILVYGDEVMDANEWVRVEDSTFPVQLTDGTIVYGVLSYFNAPLKTNTTSITATGSGESIKMYIRGGHESYNSETKLAITDVFTEDPTDKFVDSPAGTSLDYTYTSISQNYIPTRIDRYIEVNSADIFKGEGASTMYFMLQIDGKYNNGTATVDAPTRYLPIKIELSSNVEVRAFQMNTDISVGAVSEFNPSFRVVSRVSSKMIGSDNELHDVKSYGTLYTINSDIADEDMTLENSEVRHLEATKDIGTLSNWAGSTNDIDADAYSYYALTFKSTTYYLDMLQFQYKLRAYAVLDNDEVVYQTDVDETSIYEIAQALYDKGISTKETERTYLYNNVLNIVAIKEHRSSIVSALMKILKPVQGTTQGQQDYNMCNALYKDLFAYINMSGAYTGSYSSRGAFGNGKAEENQTLLERLMTVTGKSSYQTMEEWIYNEISHEQGFYEKKDVNEINAITGSGF